MEQEKKLFDSDVYSVSSSSSASYLSLFKVNRNPIMENESICLLCFPGIFEVFPNWFLTSQINFITLRSELKYNKSFQDHDNELSIKF